MCDVDMDQVFDAKATLADGIEIGYCEKTLDAVKEAMVEAGLESDEEQSMAASIWISDVGESDSDIKKILVQIRDRK